MQNLRPSLYTHFTAAVKTMHTVMSNPILSNRVLAEVMRNRNCSLQDAKKDMELELIEHLMVQRNVETAKTIVFSREQADVFMQLAESYTDGLEYILPFPQVLLQFSTPLPVVLKNGERDELIALLLFQETVTMEEYRIAKREMAWTSLNTHPPRGETDIASVAIMIYADLNVRKLSWYGQEKGQLFETLHQDRDHLAILWRKIQNLAIACIGYINCDNIYLEAQEAPPKLRKKREKQGKPVPEEYYICKIRGVQYDHTHATGTGSKHGHIYDVRGHFRKLHSGKTTWVHPHKRGLANDVYVPKTYLLEKGAKKE